MKNFILTIGVITSVLAFGFNPTIFIKKTKDFTKISATNLTNSNSEKTSTLTTLNDTIVEFEFANIQLENSNLLNFDILIRTNVNGLEFGEGILFTEYPVSAFGSNVVANNFILLQKGDVIEYSHYILNYSDETNNSFKTIVNG